PLTLHNLFINPYSDQQDLHSFPTRRSSDLVSTRAITCTETCASLLPTMSASVNPSANHRFPQVQQGSIRHREKCGLIGRWAAARSEEHTSELQSHLNLVCRLLLEKKKKHNQ